MDVTSTVDQYTGACPNENVVVMCRVTDDVQPGLLIRWTSPTFIGSGQYIQFSVDFHHIGDGKARILPDGRLTLAQVVFKDNVSITTELRTTIPGAGLSDSLTITCIREDQPQRPKTIHLIGAGN